MMMIKYLLCFLLFTNIFVLLFFNRKKIRKIFYKSKIQSVDLDAVDEYFIPDVVDEKLKSPNKNMVVETFFVPNSWNVVGMTSDYEGWILSVLSKKSFNIFEFGTCSGKTTLLFALNSPVNSKIYTITLPPDQAQEKIAETKNKKDNRISIKNAISESRYDNFMFSNKQEIQNKIKVIFQDSTKLSIAKFENIFDLIFIDGGHSYSCIKNDTEKAMKMIRQNGLIFWHDYSPGKKSNSDVCKFLNEIRDTYEIFHIKNTSLCFYKKIGEM